MPALDILLDDIFVGQLADLPDGRLAFRFADTYRALPNRPVLGQRFEDDLERIYTGRNPGQLPAFFANLLPEGKLRSVIEQSLNLKGASDLELFAAAAADLPGAVRVRQSSDSPTFGEEPSLGDDGRGIDGDDLGLRFSLAGVQLKFSAIREQERFTLPAHNRAGDWIVKIATEDYQGLAENEYTMLNWARGAGFDAPDCQLVGSAMLGELQRYVPDGSSGLAVRRYDRKGQLRIHQEDFSQVLGKQPRPDGTEKYEFTYEQLGLLVRGIATEAGADEFIRRLLFVIATGNSDAHLKNWSLLYPDKIHARLAPLYDQVATVAWPRLDPQLALKLAGSREFGRVNRDSFRRIARRLDRPETAIDALVDDTLKKIRDAWATLDRSRILPAHVTLIREHWARVPLLREVPQLEL